MTKPTSRMDLSTIDYFKPKYWPVLFSLSLLKLLGKLPLTWVRALGKQLGRLSMVLATRRRKIAQVNIQKCFPTLSNTQQKQLLNEIFENTGIGLVEIAWAWFSKSANFSHSPKVIGLNYLHEARKLGKGVILLSFHQTCLELGGAIFAHDQENIVAVYKPHRNPFFDRAMYNGRRRNSTPIPKDNVRAVLKRLKQNEVIWYAADQDYGRAQSVFVPFFKIQSATTTGTSWFVKKTGAKVIPMTHRRTKHGIQVQLHPPLEHFGEQNNTVDATQIMNFLENHLNKYPADYMWVHRRFKTRPEGEPSFYD